MSNQPSFRLTLSRGRAGAVGLLAILSLTSCDSVLGGKDRTEDEKIVAECFSDGTPAIPTSAAKGRGFQKEELQMALFGPEREQVRTCRTSGTPDLYPVSGCMRPDGKGPVDWAPASVLLCSSVAATGAKDSQSDCMASLGNPTCSCSQNSTSGAITCSGSVPAGSYSYSASNGQTVKAVCYDSSSKTNSNQCVVTLSEGTSSATSPIPLSRESQVTRSAQSGSTCALDKTKNAYSCTRQTCTYEEKDTGEEIDPQDEAVADVFLGLTGEELRKLRKQTEALDAIAGDESDVSAEAASGNLVGLSLAAARRFAEGDRASGGALLRRVAKRAVALMQVAPASFNQNRGWLNRTESVRNPFLRVLSRRTTRLAAPERSEEECPKITRNSPESLTLDFDTCKGDDEEAMSGQVALTGPKLALDLVEGLLGDRPVSLAGDLRGLLTIETNNLASRSEGDRTCERKSADGRSCLSYDYETIREEVKIKVTVLYDLGGFKFEFDDEKDTAAIRANGSVEASFEQFEVRETNLNSGKVTDSASASGSFRLETNIDAAVSAAKTGDDDAGTSKTSVTVSPGNLRITAKGLSFKSEDSSVNLDGVAALDLDLAVNEQEEFDADRGGSGPSDSAVKSKGSLLARGLKLLVSNPDGSVDLEVSTSMDWDVASSERTTGYSRSSGGRTSENTASGSASVGCISVRAKTTSAEEGAFESILETRLSSSFKAAGKDAEKEERGTSQASSSSSTDESDFQIDLNDLRLRIGVLDKSLKGGISSLHVAEADKYASSSSYSGKSSSGSSYSDEEEEHTTFSMNGGYTSFAGHPYVIRTNPELSVASSSRSGKAAGESKSTSTDDGSSSGVVEVVSGDTFTMEIVTKKEGGSFSQDVIYKLNGAPLSGPTEETLSCEEPGAVKVAIGENCRRFAELICACPTLPTGVSKNDCNLAKQGYSCELSGQTATDADCKSVLDAIAANKIDICTMQ